MKNATLRKLIVLFILPLLVLLFPYLNSLEAQVTTVTPNFGTNIHPVPKDIFGFNGMNTIRADQSWGDMLNNTNSQTRLQALNARVLRYPGGTLGNYWDWRKGWFLDKYDFQNGILLPENYNPDLPVSTPPSVFDNRLETFISCIAQSHATPMWQLNVLSSDSKYQIGSLYAARVAGVRKQYVELGNELYLTHTDNRSVFPNVDTYSQLAADWAAEIKSIPPFNTLKIAALGAESGSTDEPGRRQLWLEGLMQKIGGNQDISAVTLHHYFPAKLAPGNNGLECPCSSAPITAFEYGLADAISISREMVTDEIGKIANYGKEVWITEFNLFDTKHALHGSWFHALFTTAMLMTYLEGENVTKIMPHTLAGEGIFSGIFSTNTGLNFGQNGGSFLGPLFCQSTTNYATRPWEFTGLGNAISMITQAGNGVTSVNNIEFPGALDLHQNYSGIKELQGWYFQKDPGNGDFVIVNYSDSPYDIDMAPLLASNGTPIGSNHIITWQSIYADPCEFIKGNAINGIISNTDNEANLSTPTAVTTTPIRLERFSITRITIRPSVPPFIPVSINETEFCCNEVLSIYARDCNWEEGYYWSLDGEPVINNDNPYYFEIPEMNETTGKTIALHNSSGDIIWNQDITIFRCPGSITISSPISEFCPGDEVVLNSTAPTNYPNNWNYHWTPTKPLLNKDVNVHSTSAFPEHTTMFRQYATDGICWMKSNDLIINSSNPEPYFRRNELQVCNTIANKNVKLEALLDNVQSQNFTYEWFDESGPITACSTNVCIIDHKDQDFAIRVVVTDNLTGCSGEADMKVLGVQCCDAPVAASNLNLSGPPVVSPASIVDDNISIEDEITQALQNGGPIPGISNITNDLIIDCSGSNQIKDIYINRKLNIDKNTTFIGCNLNMGEDASIILTQAFDLELQGCSLVTCEPLLYTWRGITVNKENQFFTSVPYSTTRTFISNAETAIDISEKVTFVISGTDFYNNLHHINLHDITSKVKLKVGGYSANGASFDLGRIYNCSFNADLTYWPASLIAQGKNNPYSAISCNWVEGIHIGKEAEGNLFKNTATGISLSRSSAELEYNTFEEIYYTTNQHIRYPGTGVLCNYGDPLNGDQTNIGNLLATTTSNYFKDVNYSIVLSGGGTYNIYNNEFNGSSIGKNFFDIRLDNIIDGNIEIKDNDFWQVQTGIYGYNIHPGSALLIDNNHFEGKEPQQFNSNFRHTAITIQNSQNFNNDMIDITNNIITDMRIGVHLNQTSQAYVFHNTIEFLMPPYTNPTERYVGIYLEGGDNMNVVDNTIASDNFYTGRSSLLKGISVDQGVRNSFRCNVLENLGYSIEINSSCNPSNVENNFMNQFDVGVFYNGGNIGNQGALNKAQDNIWIQPHISSPSMKIDGASIVADRWYHFDQTFNPNNSFSPWPYNQFIITVDENESHNNNQCARAEEGDFDIDRFIASLNTDSANANPQLNYIVAERVFRLLRTDSTLQTMNPMAYAELTDLYNLYLNSTPDQLNEIERMLQDFHYEPASDMLPPVLDTNIVQEADKYIWSTICKLNLGDSLSSADSMQLFNLANSISSEVGRASFSAGAIGFIERNPVTTSAARTRNIQNAKLKSTTVEPNPTRDCFWIRIPDENYASYSLLSESGKLLETIPVKDSTGALFHCMSPGTPSGTIFIIGKDRKGKDLDINKIVILK